MCSVLDELATQYDLSKTATLSFCKVVWRRYLGEVGKFYHTVANLSKTLRINFYQNRSSIVEVMVKKFWCVFYAPQCSGHFRGLPSNKHTHTVLTDIFPGKPGLSSSTLILCHH